MEPASCQTELRNTLRLQITAATYDAHVAGLRLIEAGPERWLLATPSAQSLEWLQSPRLYPLIEAAAQSLAGEPVTVEIELAQNGNGRHAPPPAAPLEVGEAIDDFGVTFAQDVDFYTGKMTMGHWVPEFEYDRLYWLVYLGLPAYNYWRYLIAEWIELVSTKKKRDPVAQKKQERALLDLSKRQNQGWTPPFQTSYRKATKQMGKINSAVVPGGVYECHHSEERYKLRKFDIPLLPECCGAHDPCDWRPQEDGGGRGYFWREGLIHKLHRERLLAIKMLPTNRALVQVLRVLPLLTPWQVSQLPGYQQDDHATWLKNYAEKFGITPEQWEEIKLPRFTPYMFLDDLEIADYGQPPQNPFLPG
ncbi:MAG: hypothetical protein KDJ97_22545 [Anaerolineae bacterium]|nr:hypothetical protein [Anaerolineae bacterium]